MTTQGRAMATAVRLPARPEIRSRHAADRRRAARDRRGRHQIRQPHRRAAGAARRRAPPSPACSPRSKCPSAPVEWCRANLKGGKAARAGGQFRQRQRLHRQDRHGRPASSPPRSPRSAVGCKPADVFLASTGVIGEPLNAKAFDGVMDGMVAAARAGAVARRRQGDHDHRHLPQGRDRHGQASARPTVTINGIAKGAGMIAPDMATMLSFVFTDAPIARARAADAARATASTDTFNAVTIDGDTSTSDTLLAFATGAAAAHGAPQNHARPNDPRLKAFRKALQRRARRPRRAGRARRRRRAQARRDQGRGRGVEDLGAPDRACRSPTRRW